MATNILVTGTTGFVGPYLIKQLVAQGARVKALVRDIDKANALSLPQVEFVLGDIRDKASLRQAMENVETVYHLAATFRAENISDQELNDINVVGTQNMLEAAAEAGVTRFVHCSTVGVHGVPEHPPASENAPYKADNHVAISKTKGEQLAIKFMQDGELQVTVIRTGPGVYGPGDTRYLKLFKGIKKKRFIVFGSGEIQYQLIFVEDLVQGLILAGTKEEAAGEIFILTGDHSITLNQLVQMVAEIVGVKPPKLRLPVMPLYYAGHLCEIVCKPFGISPPLYRRRVDFFRNSRSFSINKAREKLGFSPQVSYVDGLRRTADWYRKMGYL
ncbi:MAG: NAD-dependent epimerase/dehydratase family protein [Anaerolineae bacterium]